jgi:hypothetical protein
MRYVVLAALVGVAQASSPFARAPSAAQAQSSTTSLPSELRFEVVSVKPSGPDERRGFFPSPTGFRATRMALHDLIGYAHRLDGYRVIGPEWMKDEAFTINATVPGVTGADDLFAMVRHLLEDRFALRARLESRPMPVYALVRARGDGRLGPNLRPSTVDCSKEACGVVDGIEQAGAQDGTCGSPRHRQRGAADAGLSETRALSRDRCQGPDGPRTDPT